MQRHLTHVQRVLTHLGIALGASVAATGANADAAGQDWKGYSAVGCLATSDGANVRRSSAGDSAISNMGTSTISVFCPVVRDVSAGGPNRVSAVAVRVRNRHATQSLRCDFSVRDINGRTFAVDTASAPPGADYRVLQLGPLNASNWGSYVLICQIPGRNPADNFPSYIVNYRVDEAL
jgi:hypothetical protein